MFSWSPGESSLWFICFLLWIYHSALYIRAIYSLIFFRVFSLPCDNHMIAPVSVKSPWMVQLGKITRNKTITRCEHIHQDRVAHIFAPVQRYGSIIGSDNGLSPVRRQATWTNAGLVLIRLLRTNHSQIIQFTLFIKEMHLKYRLPVSVLTLVVCVTLVPMTPVQCSEYLEVHEFGKVDFGMTPYFSTMFRNLYQSPPS